MNSDWLGINRSIFMLGDKTLNHIICDRILIQAHMHQFFMMHRSNDGYILLGDSSGYYTQYSAL